MLCILNVLSQIMVAQILEMINQSFPSKGQLTITKILMKDNSE